MNKCTSIVGHFDGHVHWMPPSDDKATTRSVLLLRTPGQQSTTQQWINTPTLRAVLMAIAMQRYDTARIAWWTRSRGSLEATGCHHRASIVADSSNGDKKSRFFSSFSSSLATKGIEVMSRTLITIGVWHINLMGKSLVTRCNTWLGGVNSRITFKRLISITHCLNKK
jgi:hypothetical protein